MASTTQTANGALVTTLFWSRKWSDTVMSVDVVIGTSIISGLLGAVGGISNAVVMYIICLIRKHQERKSVDILILSLCFSDLVSSVVVQPLLILLMATPHPSRTLLQLVMLQLISHCTLLSGSLGLFAITMERFINIRYPFFHANHDTKITMYSSLSIIWTITTLLAGWVLIDGEGESRGFPIVISVVFSLTMLLQIIIFLIIQAQNRKAHRQIVAVQYNQLDKQQNQTENNISNMTKRTNAQRSKTNRTILYLCIVFITTWLPSILFRLYYVMSGNGSVFLKWVVVFRVITQVHSCINPFIYSLRTERVKRALFRRFGLWEHW